MKVVEAKEIDMKILEEEKQIYLATLENTKEDYTSGFLLN